LQLLSGGAKELYCLLYNELRSLDICCSLRSPAHTMSSRGN